MTDFAQRRTMMVDTQVRPNDVTKFPIIEAMLSVPREAFVPPAKAEAAYVGENIEIGPSRVVLEPRTLAKLLDALDLQPGDRVLHVGCGLGYATAVLARMTADVTALESDAGLAAGAAGALAREGVANARVVAGDLAAGWPGEAPYDVILVEGGIEVMPSPLLDQLAEGGRIGAIFMSGALGAAQIGLKNDGAVSWRFAFNAGAPVLAGFERRREFAL